MDRLKDICTSRNIYLIEDVAQACGGSYKGKKLGSFGDLACFSFYPTKNLGAIGDAGAICLNSESLKDLIVQLRQYGWNLSRVSELPGINSRLDELQAAILLRKLRGLDESNQRRIEVAQLYDRWLDPKKFLIPKKIKDTVHVFHLYVVRLQNLDRAKLVEVLASQGIQLGIHYFPPTHLHPAFLHVSHGRLEVTESFSQEVVSLPMYPELSDDSVKRICEVINDV
jgi:dTDP-4-amino-4,6-dideoxygalactose transaminase